MPSAPLAVVVISTGPNWVDVGLLIAQVAAVIAALIAYFAIRRQIGDTERQHSEQLHSSLRPLIVLDRARQVMARGTTAWEFTVTNVGVGPAVNVEILGWPRTLSDPLLTVDEARDEMDAQTRAVDLTAPEMRVRLGALAAGASNVVVQGGAPDYVVHYVAYTATYSDVFDTLFPRGTQSEWRAGHLMVVP